MSREHFPTAKTGVLPRTLVELSDCMLAQQPHPATWYERGATRATLEKRLEALARLELVSVYLPNDPFDLDQAESLSPNDAFMLSVRGYVKKLLGQYDAALADFDRAVDIQPDAAYTLYRRAEVESILGNYEEALQDLNRALRLQPQDAVILQQRGATHIQLGAYHDALADCDRADALRPDDAFTLSRRGAAKGVLSMYKKALADLNRADALERHNPYTLTTRGVVKLGLGLREGTLADVEAAVAASRGLSHREKAGALAAGGAVKLALGDMAGARADALAVLRGPARRQDSPCGGTLLGALIQVTANGTRCRTLRHSSRWLGQHSSEVPPLTRLEGRPFISRPEEIHFSINEGKPFSRGWWESLFLVTCF
eukprot:jgi/Botrbrau1/10672/Bobra.139_2s0003.2